jgi:CD109 antigen
LIKRYNIPQVEEGDNILTVNVDYDTTEVEVDDIVTISVELEFNPPQPMEAGMIVLDISIPTGFEPVTDTLVALMQSQKSIKRYDIAGRKVIFYIENMHQGDSLRFSFEIRALFPVKAKGVTSEAYSYYQPDIRSEVLGEDITVN